MKWPRFFLANCSKSQIIVLQRQPLRQAPITAATLRINKAIARAARKDQISREVESEPFSRWRAKQIEKLKNQAGFPTQVVWYVGAAFVLKASPPICPTWSHKQRSTVCLNEFSEDDLVRGLHCAHVFHVDCLDEWYSRGHNQCPLCKSELCYSKDTAANAGSSGRP